MAASGETETRSVRLPDGRVLLAASSGAPDGLAVIFHHGWPGCRLLAPGFAEAAAERGVRLVSFDRSGYGGSSPHPGRQVADVAADTAALADALGVERFGVWGVSGGGPPALACAALLPERVVAAVSVSGFAPYDTPGLDFSAGMGPPSVEEFALARSGGARYRAFVDAAVEAARASTPESGSDWLDNLLSEPDRRYAARPEVRARRWRAEQEALRGGSAGWLEDGLAAVAPWGVPLGAIRCPVLLLQAGQDLMVPPQHGRALAEAIPHAELVLEPAEGHLTLCAEPTRPLEFLRAAQARQPARSGGQI